MRDGRWKGRGSEIKQIATTVASGFANKCALIQIAVWENIREWMSIKVNLLSDHKLHFHTPLFIFICFSVSLVSCCCYCWCHFQFTRYFPVTHTGTFDGSTQHIAMRNKNAISTTLKCLLRNCFFRLNWKTIFCVNECISFRSHPHPHTQCLFSFDRKVLNGFVIKNSIQWTYPEEGKTGGGE